MNFNTLQTLKIHQHLINSYIDLFIIHSSFASTQIM